MKAIFLIISVFIMLSGYSQSSENQKIDSIHISEVTLNVTVTNIGKKSFPIDLAKYIKVQNIKLSDQISNARSSVSLIIDSNSYYAPLIEEDRVFNKLVKSINIQTEAQLLKIECYKGGKIEISYLFIDLKY